MNIINRNEPLLSAAAAIVCEPHVASEKFILALNLSQTMYERVKKEKKLGLFCQLLPFPDVFGMRNAIVQSKRSLIFRSIWEAGPQGSPRGLKVLRKSSALGCKASPWLYDCANPSSASGRVSV